MKNVNESPIGTSYFFNDIRTTVKRLKEVLGQPRIEENNGQDKMNFQWTARTSSGHLVTIYDYKEYKPLDENEKINFHIGGFGSIPTREAQKELEELI